MGFLTFSAFKKRKLTALSLILPNSHFHVNGYSIFRRDRKKGGGGVMIFVRDSIIAMPIKIICKFVEAILLDLTIGQTRFALIEAYKPPSVDNVPFTSNMYSLLDKATSQSNNIICLGDFNCDISNPLDNNNNKGRCLLDICDIYDLDSLNNSPTRIFSAFFMLRCYPDECSRLFQGIRNFGGWPQ